MKYFVLPFHPCRLAMMFFILAATVSCHCIHSSNKMDSDTAAHVDDRYAPKLDVVLISIGGGFGPRYQICSDGSIVRYKAEDGMLALPDKKTTTYFTPELKEWKEFREALDRINVWGWKPNYIDPDIMDGTSWSVIIIDETGREIRSHGSNAYPRKFDRFLAAAKKLIGGREFR